MEKIENQIEKQLNIIIDRYLKLNTSIKNIKKYLIGKNIKTIIDELYSLETIYLKRYSDKSAKDFKNFVKDMIINILKDREYYYRDKNESMKHIKFFENYVSGVDIFDDRNWDEFEIKNFVTDWKGNKVLEDDSIWCEYDKEWCLKDEAIWVDLLGFYTIPRM